MKDNIFFTHKKIPHFTVIHFNFITDRCQVSLPFIAVLHSMYNPVQFKSSYKTSCRKSVVYIVVQWKPNMWKHYMSIKEGMGEVEGVIILKSDYHEKDIGSTMSNQLVG